MTTIRRPGSGRPIDSQVLRPITIEWPIVSCLNRFRSAAKCHGSRPSRPMTPFSDMAAMREMRMISDAPIDRASQVTRLNRDRSGDVRMGIVVFELEVLEVKIENRTD